MNNSLIGKMFDWIKHPFNTSDSDPVDWFAFLVLTLMIGLLWSKVVRQTLESV